MPVRKNKILKTVDRENWDTRNISFFVRASRNVFMRGRTNKFSNLKKISIEKVEIVETSNYGRESQNISMRGRTNNNVLRNVGQESRESRNISELVEQSRTFFWVEKVETLIFGRESRP